MSASLHLVAETLGQLHIHILAKSPDPVIPNPSAKPPPGVEKNLGVVLSYVKWTVGLIIVFAVFVGAGALAGGKFLHNHAASRVGVSIILCALGGAILLGGGYPLIVPFIKG